MKNYSFIGILGKSGFLATASLALVAPLASAQPNLILDGGFESPVVGPGGLNSGYQAFNTGQTFGSAWTVIGSTLGDVAVVPNTQTGPNGVTYTSFEGSQSLDLTGDTDNGAATGVSQTFTTVAGTTYNLSFYLGDLNNSAFTLSGAASIVVRLNGSVFQTVSNNGASGLTINWAKQSFNFTATGATTTLDFINNSSAGTAENGLDAVSVVAVPEPGMGALVAIPAVLAFLRRTHRKLSC